jgi:predicted transcriptional regulator
MEQRLADADRGELIPHDEVRKKIKANYIRVENRLQFSTRKGM